MNLSSLRTEYNVGSLDESDVLPNPIAQFGVWLEAALAADIPEPHGMTVSSVGPGGRPSSRVVLLRGFDERGLVFFTNYQSRKGQELLAHPDACISLWWPQLHRQIRIEGQMEKVEAHISDEYFASRPWGSQIASAASPQSQVIEGREVLEKRIAELEARYPESVPRPEQWGGFRLKPDYFEFWQGRPSRAHDRLVYTKQGDGWKLERLAP